MQARSFIFACCHDFFRFKSKYHPEECGKRNDEARKALKKRAEVFSKLFNIGKVEQVSVDLDKSTEMVKLLDAGERNYNHEINHSRAQINNAK